MELVAFTDADCQFDISELDRFVMLARDYDIVCGYRIDRKDSALRCLYSRVYNLLVRLLIGSPVRDIDCAMKMFRRSVIRDLEITTDGFLVNSQILTEARHRNHSIVEVGVTHRPRCEGETTVSVRHIPGVLRDLLRFWWNSVQFSGSVAPAGGATSRMLDNRRLGLCQLALLLVAAMFVFTNLGYPLIDRDETRYAEIPREMLVTGNWILPQLNFEPYYDKPPLLYWLCATSYRVFGVSEWSARFVPALAALLTVAVTMWFASRWFNRKVGLYSGLVLMLSAGFAFVSRYLLIDGVFALLVTCSLCTSLEAIRGNRLGYGWWIASAMFCGLGILSKGPLAIVLWLPPVFAFAWLSEHHLRPKLLHMIGYLSIATLVAAPWFLLVANQDSQLLTEFFVNHNFNRFAGGFHHRPIWYFIPVMLIAGHPWSFLSLPLLRFMTNRDNTTRKQRSPELGYIVLWAGWCFLFFSLSSCKLPTYLLPAAPAFAMMVGYFMHNTFNSGTSGLTTRVERFWSAKVATMTTCLAGVGFILFALVAQLEISTKTQVWALLWTILLVGTLLLMRDLRHRQTAWISSGLIAALLSVMVMHELVPAYSRSQTVFGKQSKLARQIEDLEIPIATVAHEFAEVPYYLGRSEMHHWMDTKSAGLDQFVRSHRESLLIVSRKHSLNDLRRVLPQDCRAMEITTRGPARVVRITSPINPNQFARQTHADNQSSIR